MFLQLRKFRILRGVLLGHHRVGGFLVQCPAPEEVVLAHPHLQPHRQHDGFLRPIHLIRNFKDNINFEIISNEKKNRTIFIVASKFCSSNFLPPWLTQVFCAFNSKLATSWYDSTSTATNYANAMNTQLWDYEWLDCIPYPMCNLLAFMPTILLYLVIYCRVFIRAVHDYVNYDYFDYDYKDLGIVIVELLGVCNSREIVK